VTRAHQPGSEPIDIPEAIPNPVVRSKSSDLRASKIRYESEWPWGLTKQKLIAQMSERLNREIVGVDFSTDVAFHCVRCGTDMGLATAIWSCVTPEMQQAWIVLYDAIQAEIMRAAKTQKAAETQA
jgi:hypothetical protein